MQTYTIIKTENKIIALSRYAKKPVRGTAKCAPDDTFNEEYGVRLAVARCNHKVAEKRYKHAKDCYEKAFAEYQAALANMQAMEDYLNSSDDALDDAYIEVRNILREKEEI